MRRRGQVPALLPLGRSLGKFWRMSKGVTTVKRAVIPVAGLGTRFLPVTKTVPKEMLPIVDTPALLYIVEEAVDAGIQDVVLISGRNKGAIEDFFDVSYELQERLHKDGKTEMAHRLERVQNMANIISVRQKQALGLGHAVLCAQPVVGREPFAVLLGDELMVKLPGQENVTGQLIQSFSQHGLSTVAMMRVASEDVHRYGIVEGDEIQSSGSAKATRLRVRDVLEKPQATQTSSRWALPGRYVFTADIFDYLSETKPGKNGEIQLTDAMIRLAQNDGLEAMTFQARRYDTGDKLGYLQANLELALEQEELGPRLRAYLKERASQW